jgi:hypothetical protein
MLAIASSLVVGVEVVAVVGLVLVVIHDME